MTEWKEGARQNHSDDHCPSCKLPGVLTWDFRKFGQHTMVVCPQCNCIYVDGKYAATLEGGKP